MRRTAPDPSMGQIEQARISIQNGWTHGCREERRRTAHARLDWLAGLLEKRISADAGSKRRELEK